MPLIRRIQKQAERTMLAARVRSPVERSTDGVMQVKYQGRVRLVVSAAGRREDRVLKVMYDRDGVSPVCL